MSKEDIIGSLQKRLDHINSKTDKFDLVLGQRYDYFALDKYSKDGNTMYSTYLAGLTLSEVELALKLLYDFLEDM